MTSDWPLVTLGEEADLLPGFAFKSERYSDDHGSLRLLRGDNIAQGRLRWDGLKRWPASEADGLEPYVLGVGDVVVAMDRPWIDAGLKYARVRPSAVPALLVQRVARLRAGPRMSQDFLFCLIGSPAFTQHVLSIQTGTAVPHISGSQIAAFAFPLPPLDEQRRIAGVLGALDDKIELNDRICRALEAVGALAFEEHVGRFLDDDGPAEPLSEIFEISPSRRLAPGHTAPYLEMKNMPTEGHYPFAWTQRKPGSGARFENGDTLIARITPCLENGKAAYIDFLLEGQVGWGSTEYVVLRPRLPIPLEFAYFLARHDHFRDYAVRHMTGSSGRQRVSAGEIGRYEVPVPDDAALPELASVLAGVLAAIKTRRDENRTLASIRDALLPKLVPGQIRLPEEYEPGDLKSAA